MTRRVHLNDLQLLLLAGASQRENGSLIPLPQACALEMPRLSKALASLVRRKLIEQRTVHDDSLTWRVDGDRKVGLFITAAGLAAISAHHAAGQEEAQGSDVQPAPAAHEAEAETQGKSRTSSKIASVITLLEREGGATLEELTGATGWLPHTARAALSGLRKKGHVIARTTLEGTSFYRIVPEAA
ncbi:DUF3489 domain-containing protein [Novosphingobium malaysiense]|uniref:DUF3489 domain-containing protein n=1 Tax=Novosphingobium malaysiense TaxID=1348853 RepID=A0A0B1ZU21_9SPHN|nr:DUF3489 domain-containing protein [Novosphingobium malaysiense]KHK92648.1 hypothetical protein LK12_07780 [Novosphingobium malaysiense]